MATTSKIETEILDATKVKTKSGEDRQSYFKRLITAVQDLEENVWEGFESKTQKWVNKGTAAIHASEDIPEFPDAQEQEDEEVTTKKSEKNGSKDKDKAAAKKPAAAAKSDKKPAAKADKKPAPTKKAAPAEKAAKKPAGSKGSGLEITIKNMIVKKPTITADELVEKLGTKGMKASRFTVVAIRAGFRHSIKVLQEAGLIKGTIEL